MTISSISFVASFLYLFGAFRQWLHLYNKLIFSRDKLLLIGLLATCLHSYVLYRWIDTPLGQNLCLSNLFSLVCWLISTMTLLTAFCRPIENLTVFILPITAFSIPLALLFTNQDAIPTRLYPTTLVHILMSIAAFSMLGMAALQATLLSVQNRLIRNKSANGIVRLLPPLQTMEALLFQIIWLGFILLSASLCSAFLLGPESWAGIRFQKIIFSILAWGLFAALLYGRYKSGIRGPQAIRWTLTGVVLLIIAYLGGKLIHMGS